MPNIPCNPICAAAGQPVRLHESADNLRGWLDCLSAVDHDELTEAGKEGFDLMMRAAREAAGWLSEAATAD